MKYFLIFVSIFLLISCSEKKEIVETWYMHSCISDKCTYRKKWVIAIDENRKSVVINVYTKSGKPETIMFSKSCEMRNKLNWKCIIPINDYEQTFVMIDGNFRYYEFIKLSDGSTLNFLKEISE